MIVKEIVERPASSSNPLPPQPPKPSAHKNGFPIPKRRPVRPAAASTPTPKPISSHDFGEQLPHINFQHPYGAQSPEDAQMERENLARVQAMSEQERSEEKAELMERFGPGLMDLMRKRKAQREAQVSSQAGPSRLREVNMVRQEVDEENRKQVQSMSASDRESEVNDLEQRFGAATLAAIKRRAEARQRPGGDSGPNGAPKASSPTPDIDELKEKYFPDHTSEPAKMAWMKAPSSPDSSIRFNLSGRVLSAADQATIPTTAGLHHHGSSPDLAGYTIDDILTLSRSTVPSQRITMLGVLSHILASYYNPTLSLDGRKAVDDAQAVHKGIDLGVDILLTSTRSLGLLRAGVDVLYEALGGQVWSFTQTYNPDPLLDLVPFADLLEPIQLLVHRDNGLPRNSPTIVRLLLILRRAAHHSSDLGSTITPLIPSILTHCIRAPPWPLDVNDQPYLEALHLANDVISTSRSCAQAVLDSGIGDVLLRFLVSPTPDTSDLAIASLRIFTSLGRYGLGAEFATTAIDLFRSLAGAVSAHPSLAEPYFELLTVWTTCAIDPHKTTPEHSLTWAQVSAMGWVDEAVESLRRHLSHSSLDLLRAWVVGSKINEANGGTSTIADLVESLRPFVEFVRDESPEIPVKTSLLRLDAEVDLLDQDLRLRLTQDAYENGQYEYSAFHAQRENLGDKMWLEKTLHVLSRFIPGDEPEALDLVDQLLKHDHDVPGLSDIGHADRLQILRPLLQYAILPSAASVVSPSVPNHLYLKDTTSLLHPASTARHTGLPLPADWIFAPINELLDWATSPAFAQAPPDWTPSEVEIVRATLVLSQLAQSHRPLSRSALLFNLVKIFMLEHNSQSPGDHPEAFRDDAVVASLKAVISPLLTSSADSSETIESFAQTYFGPETPFYQFYTDFVGLYEAISFSDPIFSQLVLPPLSMRYPVDYRKLLWVDHPTSLRSIRTKASDVPLEHGSLETFFTPQETDADVLAGYARALINGWVSRRTEFLWLLATWHLAALFCNESDKEVKKALMRAIVGTAPAEVIKEVVLLDLSLDKLGSGTLVDGEEKERRLTTVDKTLGDRALAKVKHVLSQ